MRSVSIIGAGLIVGTALSVIIPEGVHALYDQKIGEIPLHSMLINVYFFSFHKIK